MRSGIFGFKAKLSFLRDISQREVDCLVTVDEKPWFAVEVKKQQDGPASNLKYFRERLKIPFAYQVIKKSGIDILADGVRVVSAGKFLTGLT